MNTTIAPLRAARERADATAKDHANEVARLRRAMDDVHKDKEAGERRCDTLVAA